MTQITTCRIAAGLAGLLFGGAVAHGGAFIYKDYNGGPDNDGIGILGTLPGSADPANSFERWQQSTITYSFSPSFASAYGVAGQAAVSAAFSSWNSAIGTTVKPGADISSGLAPTDPTIVGFSSRFDLQSVALHEIGHVLGLEHPDVASKINNNTSAGFANPPVIKNYNVDANGAFVVGALPNGSHPVMYAFLTNDTARRALTNDDLYIAQFLYDNAAAGNAAGKLGGPVYGGGIPFTFSNIASGGNVLITTAELGGAALASTGVSTVQVGTNPYYTATGAAIFFNVPEPASMSALFVGAVILRRRMRSRI